MKSSPSRLSNILLLVCSTLAALLMAETALRLYKGEYRLRNFRDEFEDLFTSATPAQYDPDLGWVPRPEASREATYYGTQVTILPDGIRSNGDEEAIPTEAAPVLAVGDSFTFGDGVSDDETWPAILERLLRRRVINGGVFNYGIDQSYLRLRSLRERYAPSTIVFSFISNDINRAELSVRTGVGKPYFDVADGSLRLRNVPVPRLSRKTGHPALLQWMLGYSLTAHTVLMNYRFNKWYLRGIWDENETRAHRDGLRVTCLVFDELERIEREEGIDVYVLAQYGRWETGESLDLTRRAVECARDEGLTVVDLLPSLTELKSRDEQDYERLYHGHMSPEGNAFVAERLARAIGSGR